MIYLLRERQCYPRTVAFDVVVDEYYAEPSDEWHDGLKESEGSGSLDDCDCVESLFL